MFPNVKGVYKQCGNIISAYEGIFCANYLNSRKHWKRCQGMWYGECYRLTVEEGFRVLKPQDEEGFDLSLDEDRSRHLDARDGDHLLVPFQCELCNYRNMKNMNSGMSVEDINLLRFMRRVNLDDFPARESSTLNTTLSDEKKMERLSKNLGLESILPIMRPVSCKGHSRDGSCSSYDVKIFGQR